MIITVLDWILVTLFGILLVGVGGLTSSIWNRRIVRRIGLDINEIKRDAAHAKNNARATNEAVKRFIERQNGDHQP